MTDRDIATALTPAERHVLEHALGWLHERSPMYRNRFVAGEGHDDWSTLQGLVAKGLMRAMDNKRWKEVLAGDTLFVATIEGVRALAAQPNQPKRSRVVAKLLRETIAANRTETP